MVTHSNQWNCTFTALLHSTSVDSNWRKSSHYYKYYIYFIFLLDCLWRSYQITKQILSIIFKNWIYFDLYHTAPSWTTYVNSRPTPPILCPARLKSKRSVHFITLGSTSGRRTFCGLSTISTRRTSGGHGNTYQAHRVSQLQLRNLFPCLVPYSATCQSSPLWTSCLQRNSWRDENSSRRDRR